MEGGGGESSLHALLDNIGVFPANLVAKTADSAVLAAGLQPEDAQRLGHNHLLLAVVRGRNTLKDLEPFKSGRTAGGLVGDHAADGFVEDTRWSAEVERTCKLCELRDGMAGAG
jgi:hypothetical protein